MQLEQQVVSLELAKRLKELGVKQESIFHWQVQIQDGQEIVFISNTGITMWLKPDEIFGQCLQHDPLTQSYSAFTVAELLEILPNNDPNTGKRISFGIEFPELGKELGKYYAVSDLADYPHDDHFYDDNFANCLAELVIHLIENKLIDISEK